MPELKYKSSTFTINQYESVLDCLLRNAQAIPYACKAGMCQACLIKAVDCEAPEEARKWIKKTLQEKGYCLSCQWFPEEDVAAELPNIEEFSVAVSIQSLEKLNPSTLKLLLSVDESGSMFHYEPGQYLTLINPEGIARSYSIANSYESDGVIELHISATSHGVFTAWLFEKAKVGEQLHIRGPAGDCFYTTPDNEPFPIVLIGTGTGLAPLYGIVNEALRRNHSGPITIFHGGRSPDSLYYQAELSQLAKKHNNLQYVPVCKDTTTEDIDQLPSLIQGDLLEVVAEQSDQRDIARTQFFLCGNPTLVHSLRKQIFLSGAKSSNIYCDPFIERTINTKVAPKTASSG